MTLLRCTIPALFSDTIVIGTAHSVAKRGHLAFIFKVLETSSEKVYTAHPYVSAHFIW